MEHKNKVAFWYLGIFPCVLNAVKTGIFYLGKIEGEPYNIEFLKR